MISSQVCKGFGQSFRTYCHLLLNLVEQNFYIQYALCGCKQDICRLSSSMIFSGRLEKLWMDRETILRRRLCMVLPTILVTFNCLCHQVTCGCSYAFLLFIESTKTCHGVWLL